MALRKKKVEESGDVAVLEQNEIVSTPVDIFPKTICPRCDGTELFTHDELFYDKQNLKNVVECKKCGTYQYVTPTEQVTVWRFKIDEFGGMISPDNLDTRHLNKKKF